MRFASLGSGSRGNATLVQAGNTLVLVDCGFSCAEAERRMRTLGCAPEQLSALLVTHEHRDHIGGVARLARRHGLPVWATPGTGATLRAERSLRLRRLNSHAPLQIGELEVQPFPVPHDAREPCQFRFSDGRRHLGVVTDLGSLTQHVVRTLDRCHGLVLECNHDRQMLSEGPYPQRLKARVAGRYGHLSNDQAVELLQRLRLDDLQCLVAAHLSEKNNHPELVRDALVQGLGLDPDWPFVADQHSGLHWRRLD